MSAVQMQDWTIKTCSAIKKCNTNGSGCQEQPLLKMNLMHDWIFAVFREGGVELKLALSRGNIKRFV